MLYICVNIWPGNSLRVQKPLEEQVEPDWIHVGDADAVRQQAAGGRATAGPDIDIVFACEVDEVPNNDEVGGKAICSIIAIS